MRIQDILNQIGIQPDTGTKKQDKTQSSDQFAALLSDELAGMEGNVPSNSVTGCDSTDPLAGLLGVGPVGANSELSQPLAALDDTLTSLDSLGQALGSDKSPREINTLIDKINMQAAGLDDKLSGLPADHPLKGLGEEVKIAAYTESVKWNRGDYL